jgi:enoyl-[acyl-carrier protein] reductase I
MNNVLAGKKGLVVGIANDKSIAWGCAQAFSNAGAELAVTYQNAKAEPYVRPLAEKLQSTLVLPLDVQDDVQMSAVFNAIREKWGRLDFVLHAIAFAPKEDLQGRVTDSSREGFLKAMDISCHSLMRIAHLAEPLMDKGGALLTTSYYGSEKVVEHYGIMGPVKAALEASVRYMAVDLGPKGIRVNALSPGPLSTRAASGISHFDELLEEARVRSPQHDIVTIDAIGAFASFLVSDEARYITGNTEFIDAGYHIIGG